MSFTKNKSTGSFFVNNNINNTEDDKPIQVPNIIDPLIAKINTNIQSAITSIQSHSIINTFKSGGIIGGHRLVFLNNDNVLQYADINNLNGNDNILGLTLDSGQKNDIIRVQHVGIITEATWNFSVNKKLFLSTEGFMTHNIPTQIICKEIGYAISKTKLMLRIQRATFLCDN